MPLLEDAVDTNSFLVQAANASGELIHAREIKPFQRLALRGGESHVSAVGLFTVSQDHKGTSSICMSAVKCWARHPGGAKWCASRSDGHTGPWALLQSTPYLAYVSTRRPCLAVWSSSTYLLDWNEVKAFKQPLLKPCLSRNLGQLHQQ